MSKPMARGCSLTCLRTLMARELTLSVLKQSRDRLVGLVGAEPFLRRLEIDITYNEVGIETDMNRLSQFRRIVVETVDQMKRVILLKQQTGWGDYEEVFVLHSEASDDITDLAGEAGIGYNWEDPEYSTPEHEFED